MVVGPDHPFEQPFIRRPNGTGVAGVEIDFNDAEILQAIYKTRLVDTKAFVDFFPTLVQNLKAPFNTTNIGSFGYSLGGASAIGVLFDDDRLLSGLNLHGSLLRQPAFNDTRADAKKPAFSWDKSRTPARMMPTISPGARSRFARRGISESFL